MTSKKKPKDTVSNTKLRSALKLFGMNVRMMRESKSLSRRKLADKTLINPLTIRAIEAGSSKPSFETALRLAMKLGMSLDEVLKLAS